MKHTVIAENLGKKFYRNYKNRPRTFIEAFSRGVHRAPSKESFWGLKDVSFQIAPGQIMGIIGSNGAGKSTLLRLIGGVSRPDQGSVKVRGRIGGFLDLTAGFRGDLSGRENVYVSGVIAGLTRQEVTEQFDSIVAFSEIENFIDSPVRTYSTGMRMRLAFAVAAHTEPDVLIIDEVLAVGDAAFRRKCFRRIDQFKTSGCTILIVSHEAGQIRKLCDEVLWLRKGRLVARGTPEEVMERYIKDTNFKIEKPTT